MRKLPWCCHAWNEQPLYECPIHADLLILLPVSAAPLQLLARIFHVFDERRAQSSRGARAGRFYAHTARCSNLWSWHLSGAFKGLHACVCVCVSKLMPFITWFLFCTLLCAVGSACLLCIHAISKCVCVSLFRQQIINFVATRGEVSIYALMSMS